MGPVFRRALARWRGQILGWGVVLALIGAATMPAYDAILHNSGQLKKLLQELSPWLMAFSGVGDKAQIPSRLDPADPGIFLTMNFFSFMPIILGVFAVLGGSGLLASDEENGTLDLVLAHPVSRSAVFLARLAAFGAATVAVLVIAWLGLAVPAHWSAFPSTPGALALPFVSLLAVLLLFGTLALLGSMLLPSRVTAAMAAGIVLVVSYFITSLAPISPAVRTVAWLSPLDYYQSGYAVNGLDWAWLAGLLAASAVFAGLAWWRFERRDIRVAGEGSWGWPWQRARRLN
jgi:ABC-2 type transport system permease protein